MMIVNFTVGYILSVGCLVATGHSVVRRGGSAVVQIACSGCNAHIQYASSSISGTESRRNVVSYALRLAAFASGMGFAEYHR